MDKRQKGYEAFIAELQKQWQETEEFQGERLNRMIAKVQAYLEAASDLTQDELALIAEYVKRDWATMTRGAMTIVRRSKSLPLCWPSKTPPGPGWRM